MVTFDFNNNSNIFDGLFSYMSKKINVQDFNKIFKAESPGSDTSRIEPIQLLNHSYEVQALNDEWFAPHEKNVSIYITFLQHLFRLDSYSFRSRIMYQKIFLQNGLCQDLWMELIGKLYIIIIQIEI